MNIRNLSQLMDEAKKLDTKKLAVACAADHEVILAVSNAVKEGIVDPVLIGNKADIEALLIEEKQDLSKYTIIDIDDKVEACREAVRMVSSKEADVLMKGLVDTSIILKAVLDKEIGLRTGKVLSHTMVMEVPGFDRLMFMSDGAMNLTPNLDQKKQILENTIEVCHALGNPDPKVAVLAAVEKVNPKMPATVDAHELEEMNKRGEITGCTIGGPFALDNAVSKEAAAHKGIDHPVAGNADVFIVPFIEVGNVFYKALVFMGTTQSAGIICGAAAPIVLTSRADSDVAKLNSIALAAMIADHKN